MNVIKRLQRNTGVKNIPWRESLHRDCKPVRKFTEKCQVNAQGIQRDCNKYRPQVSAQVSSKNVRPKVPVTKSRELCTGRAINSPIHILDSDSQRKSRVVKMPRKISEKVNSAGGACMLEIQVLRQPVKALLDSGASTSCLSWNFFKTLKTDHSKLSKISTNYTSATGQDLITVGFAWIETLVLGKTLPVRYVIIRNLTEEAILGLDFLEKNRATVDFGKRSIKLLDTYNVRVLTDAYIQPYSQKIVSAEILDAGPSLDKDSVYFEKSMNLPPLVPSSSVSIVNKGRIPVIISNPTSIRRKLNKNTHVGTCSPVQVLLEDELARCETGRPAKRQRVLNVRAKESSAHIDENIAPPCHRDTSHLPLATGNNCDLSVNGQKRLNRIIHDYEDIFYNPNEPYLGTIKNAELKVQVKATATPFYKSAYRMSPHMTEELRRLLEEQEKLGLIERTTSGAWSSPCFLVQKPRRKPTDPEQYRVVVDLRKVNQSVHRIALDLPNILTIYDKLGKQFPRLFGSLDLFSGFHQLNLHPDARDICAFSVPYAPYKYRPCRAPMGFSNSPAYFHQVVQEILAGNPNAHLFIDDILLVAGDEDEFFLNLEDIFSRLRKANVKLKGSKCELGLKELKYLGRILTPTGIKIDPEKVKVILQFPAPKTPTELKRFLGMAGFHRIALPDFSTKVAPLLPLLSKGNKFIWTDEHEQAFLTIKSALTNAEFLLFPDWTKPFFLLTDASKVAISAALYQRDQVGLMKPISFCARSLTKFERSYGITRLEQLGVIYGINQYDIYLKGKTFFLCTDHEALKHLLHLKEGPEQIMRWSLILADYNFHTCHISGDKHVTPDFLSRLTLPDEGNVSVESYLNQTPASFIIDTITSVEPPVPELPTQMESAVHAPEFVPRTPHSSRSEQNTHQRESEVSINRIEEKREEFTFFWGRSSPFSQMHPAQFNTEDTHFNCAEQYMMYRKAMYFGDEQIADAILSSESPYEQKALGKQVRGFELNTWLKVARDIVIQGNLEKFSQDKQLLNELLATGSTTLVECSQNDCIWGIGLTKSDPRVNNRKEWKGTNWLGECLMIVRNKLRPIPPFKESEKKRQAPFPIITPANVHIDNVKDIMQKILHTVGKTGTLYGEIRNAKAALEGYSTPKQVLRDTSYLHDCISCAEKYVHIYRRREIVHSEEIGNAVATIALLNALRAHALALLQDYIEGDFLPGKINKINSREPQIKESKRLCRVICYHLRHNGRIMRQDGFVKVSALLKLKQLNGVDIETILKIARNEKRFQVTKERDVFLIRAKYGHSIHAPKFQRKSMDPSNLPRILYHATQTANIEAIMNQGLEAGGRTHVHLTNNILYVQERAHKYDAVVRIDAHEMLKNGVTIYRASNDVFLVSNYIPPQYLIDATELREVQHTCAQVSQIKQVETSHEYLLKRLKPLKTDLSIAARELHPQYTQDVDRLIYIANSQTAEMQGLSEKYVATKEPNFIPLLFNYVEQQQNTCMSLDVVAMQADSAPFSQKLLKLTELVESNAIIAHKLVDLIKHKHDINTSVSWPATIAYLYRLVAKLRAANYTPFTINNLPQKLIDIADKSVTCLQYQTVIIGVQNSLLLCMQDTEVTANQLAIFHEVKNSLAEILLQYPLTLALNHQDEIKPDGDKKAVLIPAILGILRANFPGSGIERNGFLQIGKIVGKLKNEYTEADILDCQTSIELQFVLSGEKYLIRARNYHSIPLSWDNYRQVASRKAPARLYLVCPISQVMKEYRTELIGTPSQVFTLEKIKSAVEPTFEQFILEINIPKLLKTGTQLYTLNDYTFVIKGTIPAKCIMAILDSRGMEVHVSNELAQIAASNDLIAVITRAATRKPKAIPPKTNPPLAKKIKTPANEKAIPMLNLARDLYDSNKLLLSNIGFTVTKFIEQQNADTFIWAMKAYLLESKLPQDKEVAQRIVLQHSVYCVYEQVLYRLQLVERNRTRKVVPVVPSSLKCHFLAYAHIEMTAHSGFAKTLAALHDHVFWPHMSSECLTYVMSCQKCRQYKHTTQPMKHPQKSHEPVATCPNEQFFIDTVSLPLANGYKHLLVILDAYSGYIRATPLRNVTTQAISHALLHTLVYKGICPSRIISDNATAFLAKPMAEVAAFLKIKWVNISPYNPRSNASERSIQTIVTKLRVLCEDQQKLWVDKLDAVLLAINSSVHGTLLYPPFLIQHGYMPRQLETLQAPSLNDTGESALLKNVLENQTMMQSIILENRKKSEVESKTRYDARLTNKNKLAIGDIVYLRQEYFQGHSTQGQLMKKMSHLYKGPYVVVQLVSNETVRIKDVFSNELFYRPVNTLRLKLGTVYSPPTDSLTHI